MTRFSAAMAVILTLFFGFGTGASAQGEVVLSITLDGEVLTYDLAALEEMGSVTIETSTIWTEGLQEFSGVSLDRVLAEIGVTDGLILASAINDYTVEIPVADAVEGGPIVAFRNNGEPMSIREKGPLWIVYPYDSKPEYQSEVIYSRSIWQLDRIEIAE